MTQSLDGAIANLQSKALALSGTGLVSIKAAPSTAPESVNAYPFSVAYPRKGNIQFESAGWANQFHTIFVELHWSRQVLTKAISQAIPFCELFEKAILADPTLGGTVQEVNELRHEFGQLEWNDITDIGWRFEVDVKLAIIA